MASLLMFKLFDEDPVTNRLRKIQKKVNFETALPVSEGPPYSLRGVMVHTGSFSSGHYTAYVRAQNNRWYYCDDAEQPQEVTRVEDVLKAQAYMLFYER